MMETSTRQLFARYERSFRQALAGKLDMDEVASLYASDFVAATPAGVMSGKNDAQLKEVMAAGYAQYRNSGMTDMRIRSIRLTPLDALHCVAHVGWTATYARAGQPDLALDFDVHYFVQVRDGDARVFGWVAGDEQALLKAHGIG